MSREPKTKKCPFSKVLVCLDAAGTHRRTLQTLAALLEHCGEISQVPLRPEMVGETGSLMLIELKKMRVCLEKLQGLTLEKGRKK